MKQNDFKFSVSSIKVTNFTKCEQCFFLRKYFIKISPYYKYLYS